MLGISLSTLSGYGLTYGYSLDEHNVVKAKLFGFSTNEGSSPDKLYLEAGIEYRHNFKKHGNPRWYFLLGGFYTSQKDWYSTTYDCGGTYYRSSHTKSEFGAGLGIGSEFSFWEYFLFNIDAGFGYCSSNLPLPFSAGPYIGPGVGLGLMYRF